MRRAVILAGLLTACARDNPLFGAGGDGGASGGADDGTTVPTGGALDTGDDDDDLDTGDDDDDDDTADDDDDDTGGDTGDDDDDADTKGDDDDDDETGNGTSGGVSTGPPPCGATLSPDVVACYDFDSVSALGDVVYDQISEQNLDLDPIGEFVPGFWGQALSTDVPHGGEATMPPLQSATIEIWMSLDGGDWPELAPIVALEGAVSTHRLTLSAAQLAVDSPEITGFAGPAEQFIPVPAEPFDACLWIQYDDAGASMGVRIDGMDETVDFTGEVGLDFNAATLSLGPAEGYAGFIDGLRVWSIAIPIPCLLEPG